MSCCGKMREQARGGTPPEVNALRGPATEERAVIFRCTGAGVAAYGPITGRLYEFNGHGATVGVDERDAPALAMVPQLEPLRRG